MQGLESHGPWAVGGDCEVVSAQREVGRPGGVAYYSTIGLILGALTDMLTEMYPVTP